MNDQMHKSREERKKKGKEVLREARRDMNLSFFGKRKEKEPLN